MPARAKWAVHPHPDAATGDHRSTGARMPSTGTHRPQSPDRGASAEATNGASMIAGAPTTTAHGKPVSDPAKDFAELVRRELKLSDRESDRVSGKRWLEQPPRSLFGLALSLFKWVGGRK